MNQRVLIAFVLFLVAVAGAQVYTVTDLGPLTLTPKVPGDQAARRRRSTTKVKMARLVSNMSNRGPLHAVARHILTRTLKD